MIEIPIIFHGRPLALVLQLQSRIVTEVQLKLDCLNQIFLQKSKFKKSVLLWSVMELIMEHAWDGGGGGGGVYASLMFYVLYEFKLYYFMLYCMLYNNCWYLNSWTQGKNSFCYINKAEWVIQPFTILLILLCRPTCIFFVLFLILWYEK